MFSQALSDLSGRQGLKQGCVCFNKLHPLTPYCVELRTSSAIARSGRVFERRKGGNVTQKDYDEEAQKKPYTKSYCYFNQLRATRTNLFAFRI